MIYKRYLVLATLAVISVLTACQSSQPENQEVSVSEEIALGVSEDIIPLEAFSYSKLSFDVPEGMEADSDNTVDACYYFATELGDLSYITYSKRAVDASVNYDALNAESYKESLENQLGNEIVVEDFVREDKDGYTLFRAEVSYSNNDNNYNLKEYIFVTDEYLFFIDYCLGGETTLAGAFEESEKSIKLESAVDSLTVIE